MYGYKTNKRGWYNAHLGAMKQERTTWEPTLRDIADHMAPYSHEFEVSEGNNGRRRDGEIINNMPTDALETAVSGLFSHLCNPAEKWAGLEAVNRELNKIHNVQVYCQEVSEILLSELSRSNYYTCVPEDFESIFAFGTCASLRLESYDRAAFWFYTLPIGSYWISNNHERIVDTIAREWQMTARQMIEQFGEGNVSAQVRDAAARPGGSELRFTVAHMIHPNPEFKPGNKLWMYKRYRSCYWEIAGQNEPDHKMLLEEGFDLFPGKVCRWKTKGNDSYGHGQGHFNIGDCKMLQSMEYDKAYLTEMLAKPPTISGPGSNFNPLSSLPGSHTQATDDASAQSVKQLYDVNFDISKLELSIEKVSDRIRRRNWNHIFQMIINAGHKVTATEIMQRANEKGIALTPILRLENEYLTPDLAGCVNILGKRGLLPPPPAELEGQELKLVYKSPLSEAAHMQRAQKVNGHLGGYLPLIAQFSPESIDNYDFDEMTRGQAIDDGLPARYLVDAKIRDEKRAQRNAEMAKMQQLEQVQAVANTAKTLGQADTEGKNALTDTLASLDEQ